MLPTRQFHGLAFPVRVASAIRISGTKATYDDPFCAASALQPGSMLRRRAQHYIRIGMVLSSHSIHLFMQTARVTCIRSQEGILWASLTDPLCATNPTSDALNGRRLNPGSSACAMPSGKPTSTHCRRRLVNPTFRLRENY